MSADSAARTTTAKNMAVFIDADNLNDPTALDHVLTTLRSKAERVLYKRAYGRTESLKGIEAVLWRHGVRPVANMIVNKVTTDSALVIDAVEAVCSNHIDAVAICSGDADFVPLVTWMRERGCYVFCFSLANKIFANPESFYDDVVLLEVVEDESAAAETPSASSVQPLYPVTGQPHLDMVEQVLTAFPALRSGEPQQLSQVVAVLRQYGILNKSIKTAAWFEKWALAFRLLPQPVPNRIIYQKPSAAAHPLQEPHSVPVQRGDPEPARQWPPIAPQHPSAVPDEVARILKALPDLRYEPQMLSQAVPVLRQKTILGKHAKSTEFFAPYAAYFTLSPAHQPMQLPYTAPCRDN
ncbi:NYN domain-containing protein [Simplicispira psychrophila]|uniref:NYN domain-containing protein n=1 Tax=Simplicispira psychrophila TaxID=80882 RepID=UPI000A0278BC|nr:NYN domain-containing protein [Simplicispira psychrophila]